MTEVSICNCESKIIPKALHQEHKTVEHKFEIQETFYRRFPPIDNNQKKTLEQGILSASVFSTNAMSMNRSKYSSEPEDVLFDTSKDCKHEDWGIISLTCSAISLFIEVANDNTYCLQPIHKPEPCMYPHMKVFVKMNDMIVENFQKPPLMKTLIKQYFRSNAVLIKKPK